MVAFAILISIIFSAFFSGMEIAYISNNRLQLELEKKKDNFISKLFVYLSERPKKFITTMLLGNTIALVSYGYFAGEWLTTTLKSFIEISDGLLLILQTILSTLLIIVTAEFIPKALFSLHSFRLFKTFTLPAFILFWILSPLTFIVRQITRLFFKIFKVEEKEEESAYLKEELSYFLSEKIEENQEQELDSEIQIFQNALNFSDIKARDCLVPRNEIIAVESTEAIDKVKEIFIETGLSKIIVYNENIDHVIGYIHTFDLFKKPKNIKSILLPIENVYETTSAKDIMNRLIKKRKSVALVLDEYGGTAGMLTLEDIVEELFGDIEDEHDVPIYKEERIDEDHYRFSTRLEIDYLNEHYNLSLPKNDQYETLGGMLVSINENIPKEGETINYKNYKFLIEKVSETKIEEVYLTIYKE